MKKLSFAFFALLFAAFSFAAEKKNVIFVVADGGGPAAMGLLLQYARYAENSPYADRTSNLEKIFSGSELGIVLNATKETIVTDSAAAGTHMAKGTLTYPEYLGMGSEGENAESLLKKAKNLGMATGLITDVYLSDATPSAYTAYVNSRRNYEEISAALLSSGADVLLGGGLNYFISDKDLKDEKYAGIFKKIPYSKNLSPALKNGLFEKLITSGYPLVFDKKGLQKAKSDKLLGLFGASAIQFSVNPAPYAPTLKDMTEKALEILSKNKNGFFLMVEAGALDWMLHDNDQGAALAELLELDETLGLIKDWADKNPDTMVIITADHDTGGFGFQYRKVKGDELELKKEQGYPLYDKKDYSVKSNLDIIAKQTKMQRDMKAEFNALGEKRQTPKAIQQYLMENMGYELPLDFIEDKGDFEDCLKEINKRLGVTWSTGNHTGSPLFISFYGAGAPQKPGVLHNTEVNKIIERFLYDGK